MTPEREVRQSAVSSVCFRSPRGLRHFIRGPWCEREFRIFPLRQRRDKRSQRQQRWRILAVSPDEWRSDVGLGTPVGALRSKSSVDENIERDECFVRRRSCQHETARRTSRPGKYEPPKLSRSEEARRII